MAPLDRWEPSRENDFPGLGDCLPAVQAPFNGEYAAHVVREDNVISMGIAGSDQSGPFLEGDNSCEVVNVGDGGFTSVSNSQFIVHLPGLHIPQLQQNHSLRNTLGTFRDQRPLVEQCGHRHGAMGSDFLSNSGNSTVLIMNNASVSGLPMEYELGLHTIIHHDPASPEITRSRSQDDDLSSHPPFPDLDQRSPHSDRNNIIILPQNHSLQKAVELHNSHFRFEYNQPKKTSSLSRSR